MVTRLPNDTIAHVFSFLKVSELQQCVSVSTVFCTVFHDISNNDDFFKFFRQLQEKESVSSEDIAESFRLINAKKIIDLTFDLNDSIIPRLYLRTHRAVEYFFSRCSSRLREIKCNGNLQIGKIACCSFDYPVKFLESLLSLQFQAAGHLYLDDTYIGECARNFPRVQQIKIVVLAFTPYENRSDYANPRSNFISDTEVVVMLDLNRYRRDRLTYFERFKQFLSYYVPNILKREVNA